MINRLRGAPRPHADPRPRKTRTTTRPTRLASGTLALGCLGALCWPSDARAFCAFSINGWAESCESADGEAACVANAAQQLIHPTPLPRVIPVYLNFGTTTFPVPHPNHPDDPTQVQYVHRSLTLTGLSKDVVTAQVRLALAQWNQASPSQPMLYLAGETTGDTSKVANRPVGITIDAEVCWSTRVGAGAFAGPPNPTWTVGDNTAYRARVTLMPYLHSVVGLPAGPCSTLPEDLKPATGFKQVARTSRIKDGLPAVLVHELGHALGLNHDFFIPDGTNNDNEIPSSCGLGDFGVQKYGVMSYSLPHPTQPRRDDIEGMVALFGSYLPRSWPLQAWRALGALPNSDAAKDLSLNGLSTTIPPVVTNQAVTTTGRIGLIYASLDRQIHVRTITNGVLDPVVGLADQPIPGPQGQTYAPAGVALATAPAQAQQLFAIWNVDDPTVPELKTRWATRTLMNGAWSNYGPEDLAVSPGGGVQIPGGSSPIRHHPALGVTYDPVYDDYVVVTVSSDFQPGVSIIERTGARSYGPTVLRKTSASAVNDYNSVGAPICIRRTTGSLCLLPVTSSGDTSRVGVLAFTRSSASSPFSLVTETLSNEIGYGQVAISWNAKTSVGSLSFVNDKGDTRWLRVNVAANNGVSFANLAWSMDGNGRYDPTAFDGAPREVVSNMRYTWPLCPYWGATSAGVGDPSVAASAVTVARALCKPFCGDGHVDQAGAFSEECDGQELAGETCESQGYLGGTLTCRTNCTLDVGRCTNDVLPGPPDSGDCVEVIQTCGDVSADGCYPDGPGSFGRGGTGTGFGGYYCPDNEGPAVCSLARNNGQLEPKCLLCPEPGEGGAEAGYGCACDSDADCAPSGWASTSGAPNGVQVALSCFGSTDQGWSSGPGRCLPAIDPYSPQLHTTDDAALEEFERTRWLCKQSCASMTDALGTAHVCHYRQGGLQLDYAACVDAYGCDGHPEGGCEEGGDVCGATDICEAQCSPANNVNGIGNADCLVFGFPEWYQCAHGWAAEGLCVPPECAADPLSTGLDLSACMMFLAADVF